MSINLDWCKYLRSFEVLAIEVEMDIRREVFWSRADVAGPSRVNPSDINIVEGEMFQGLPTRL